MQKIISKSEGPAKLLALIFLATFKRNDAHTSTNYFRSTMKVLNMRLAQGTSNLKAFFDVETGESITIKGFKVAQSATGLFVGMPSEKDQNGKWWDKVIMPKELKAELQELALEEYRTLSGNTTPASPPLQQKTKDTDLPF
jgi:DNA-binding cell septation regulator SpoVG